MAEEFFEGEAGFSQTIDRHRHVLELRIWGFFSEKLAGELLATVGAAMRALPRPWYFLLRCEDLLPQNTAGQDALRTLLGSAGNRGMRRGVIVIRKSLTKLQLHRLLRACRARDTESWAFFEEEAEALQWLLRPQPSRPPFDAESENDAIIGDATASIDSEGTHSDPAANAAGDPAAYTAADSAADTEADTDSEAVAGSRAGKPDEVAL